MSHFFVVLLPSTKLHIDARKIVAGYGIFMPFLLFSIVVSVIIVSFTNSHPKLSFTFYMVLHNIGR